MRETFMGFLAALILTSGAGAIAQPAAPDTEPPPGGPAETSGTPTVPAVTPAAVAATGVPAVTYAVGTRLRALFVPAWFLEAFMTHAHALNSFTWGADVTRRKGNLDIVLGLDVGWYGNFKDANWTGNDKSSYAGDTYWTEFRNFVFTSIDINWMWHYDLTEWLAFRAGGGVGIGFLGGNYYKTLSSGCSPVNVDDKTQCYPSPGTARQKEDLKYYRVLPVVSALLGFRFKLHPHVVATLEGGFHNGFVFGASGQYIFF
jgi:hypothetical protein